MAQIIGAGCGLANGLARVFIAAAIDLVLTGCAATATDLKSASLLQQIDAEPLQWQNKVVEIEGRFSGWQGKCKGAPPVSRSDWMLEDGDSCIYVNGRLPAGFSSLPPGTGTGKMLVIRGMLHIDAKGRPYVESERVEPR